MTSTAVITVGSAWVNLGTGPLTVQVEDTGIYIAVSDTQPNPTDTDFQLPFGAPFTVNSTSQVWARSVTGAPVGVAIVAGGPQLVVPQDNTVINLSASAATVLTNATYATGAIPTTGYSSASVQLTGIGTGNTITYETSNDGVTWYQISGSSCGNVGTGSAAVTDTALVLRQFLLAGAFFRVRISTYGSGTVTASVCLKVSDVASPFSTMSLATNQTVTLSAASAVGNGYTNARNASSAATTNLSLVKSTQAKFYRVNAINTSATTRYLKIYNASATANVTVGSTSPAITIPLLASGPTTFDLGIMGIVLTNGLVYAITANAVDSDATAIAAGDIVGLNVFYT